MNVTGQGRPLSSRIGGGGSPPDRAVVLEALGRHVTPAQVESAVSRSGRRSKRLRKIPAHAVVWLVIAIGLWGDLDVPALWRQVVGTLASLLACLVGRPPPCKSALSQARARLGARPMRLLFGATAGPVATGRTRGALYEGMPLKAMDAQDYSIPDTPANAKAFGRPGTKRYGKAVAGGYPQIHVNRLIEVGTHMTIEALIKPQAFNEHPTAPALLDKCAAGDLVLWDCGFYSYGLIARALRQAKHMLGPVPCHAVLEPIGKRLADGSYRAKIYPTTGHRARDKGGVLVRVIEYTFDDPARPGCGERHRLVTTLADPRKYPARELVVLYHQRWEIEIDNDEITTHQLAGRAPAVTELRSKTPVGVVQELYGVLLAHNAVRALMHESATLPGVDVDPRTLSFVHAVRVIREAIPLLRAAPAARVPLLYQAMIAQIALGRLPPREGRINPRVVKVKMSNFPKKRPEHYHLPHPTKSFKASIVMLN